MVRSTQEYICCKVRELKAWVLEQIGEGGGTEYTAGTGLSLTGNQFAIDSTVTTNGGTQTLTNKTLTTPRVELFHDAAGAPWFGNLVSGTAYVLMGNYDSVVFFTAQGADTNIDLNFVPKGSGRLLYQTHEVGWKVIPSNPQSANYSTVLSDSGQSIDHPATDANSRAFTIDNAVAYPTGTCITFTNMAANNCTILLSSGTLYLAGSGTTGTRTLAQYGIATVRKLPTGDWLISGTGLT